MRWFDNEPPQLPEEPLPLTGVEKFDQCSPEVRVIEIRQKVYDTDEHVHVIGEDSDGRVPSDVDLLYPTGDIGVQAIVDVSKVTVNRRYAGSQAILHCPLTEDPLVTVMSAHNNHNGQTKAIESLRSQAAERICGNCDFSGKTLLDVIAARTAAARADIERIEVMKARALALKELEDIDPDFRSVH
ncbi:MAG TPA: hypothetical protein VF572_05200 [Candidatus Saccharimonadales bacterium]